MDDSGSRGIARKGVVAVGIGPWRPDAKDHARSFGKGVMPRVIEGSKDTREGYTPAGRA